MIYYIPKILYLELVVGYFIESSFNDLSKDGQYPPFNFLMVTLASLFIP